MSQNEGDTVVYLSEKVLFFDYFFYQFSARPNLRNLSRGFKMVGSMFHELSRRSIENGFWWILDAAQIH